MHVHFLLVVARFSEEGQEDQAKHIKGGEERGQQAESVEDAAAVLALIRAEQDGILAEETGEGRESSDGQRGSEHGEIGPADFFAEAAHARHVLLATHGVNDAARGEEEQRFEEGVGHQVEDAGGEGADSEGEEHVAELADRGVGEDALDVRLHEADGGSEERGGAADDGDDEHRSRSVSEENVRAGDDVDPGGDHGGGVNQCADRCGAFHGVRQPDIEGKLRRFTASAHEEQQARDGDGAELAHRIGGQRGGFAEQRNEIERAEGFEEQEHAEHEAEVADAVDDESFFSRVRSGLAQEIKTDEQVAREADAFPSDEEQHVIGGEDEDEHEEHEEVEVGEETVVAALVGHIARRVDVDEPADSGDDQQHDDREVIDLEIEARAEIAGDNPGEVLLNPGDIFRREVCEFADGFERGEERESRGADRNRVDDFVWPLAAEKAVDRRAEQRQRGNDPEIVQYGHQSLSKLTSSTFSVLRLRVIMMMMPSPTAASAAATTITKSTNTWPSSLCQT